MDTERSGPEIRLSKTFRGALGAGFGGGTALLTGATPIGVITIAALGASIAVIYGGRRHRRS